MPEGQVQRPWPDPPPGSRASLGTRAWRLYRELRRRGVLTVRRLGCAVLVLVVVAVAALALLDRAADGVASLFVDEPDAVAGSPFDTVAPSAPTGSGSEVVDRIVARDRLIVAVQEVPGLVERDPATGDYTGFDIALLDLVARELGVDPERTSFKPLPAGLRAGALERGEVDLAAGGYEITDQRRAEAAFAGPYLITQNSTRYGFGVPPGDDVLRNRVQAVLRAAVEDGTWKRLYAEHLGTPVPEPPPLGR
ncbi:MAG: transporter substrate-binding domain-containing protein [Actinomycetota bacterium]|nr:transporter substrate-binding domain-containing protein [Actinomycetota bacterium]